VHDPARSNGYSYVYNKSSISQSWFAKGGVAYTFFPESTSGTTSNTNHDLPAGFEITRVFPNPFNASTRMTLDLPGEAHVTVQIFNLRGQLAATDDLGEFSPGRHDWRFDATQLSSGVYHCQFRFVTANGETQFKTQKISIVR